MVMPYSKLLPSLVKHMWLRVANGAWPGKSAPLRQRLASPWQSTPKILCVCCGLATYLHIHSIHWHVHTMAFIVLRVDYIGWVTTFVS